MRFSTLTRLYTSVILRQNQILELDNEQFFYLKSVMRLKKGNKLRVVNGGSGEFISEIESISRNSMTIRIISLLRTAPQEPELILALCIIKQDRMIEAIKAAVQIGVTQIIPVISEYTQYKTIASDKIEKVIISSLEQSERFHIPILHEPCKLECFLKHHDSKQIIFASEEESCHQLLSDTDFSASPILLIGAEGGFSQSETQLIRSWDNVLSVTLGDNVLRSETAVSVGLGAIQILRKHKQQIS